MFPSVMSEIIKEALGMACMNTDTFLQRKVYECDPAGIGLFSVQDISLYVLISFVVRAMLM